MIIGVMKTKKYDDEGGKANIEKIRKKSRAAPTCWPELLPFIRTAAETILEDV